ncbi:hypothetical protein [Flavobacterium terrisoli]|uniref:hypothetical protein n=1 Tax=Flavobacterium terrisoli TaxID=3242195 RepID=UPI002543C333|nr:hypothetical protein [Flavobacterium buctense]
MEKLFFALLFFNLSFGQTKATVEKSIFGLQTGLLGIWGHNETRLSNQTSLRSELGLDFGISGDDNSTTTALIPSIRLEPRWYYNLEKRIKKEKSIAKNSGNFLALNIVYNPDWFIISNEDNVKVISTLAFVPKWGIKRTVGNHFTYEAGIGIGGFLVLNDYETDSNVAVDLHLRIGYTF